MLDLQVAVAGSISIRIFDAAGNPATGSVTPVLTIYDEATYTLQATINMTFKVSGIFSASWTPPAVGLYDLCIDESTIPFHFYTTVLVGNSDDENLAAHILNLSNAGQEVTLGAGSGQVTYTNGLTFNGNPLQNVEVRCFQAQTVTASGGTKYTHITASPMYAHTNTNTLGSFTLYLDPGYYVLQYIDSNDGFNTVYINYSGGAWTTSTTEINP